MKTILYTVYDRIAMRCGPIFHAVNDADAIRGFKKRYKDQEDRSDFRLLRLGAYDHEKGNIDSLDIPEDVSVNFGTTETKDSDNFGTTETKED